MACILSSSSSSVFFFWFPLKSQKKLVVYINHSTEGHLELVEDTKGNWALRRQLLMRFHIFFFSTTKCLKFNATLFFSEGGKLFSPSFFLTICPTWELKISIKMEPRITYYSRCIYFLKPSVEITSYFQPLWAIFSSKVFIKKKSKVKNYVLFLKEKMA